MGGTLNLREKMEPSLLTEVRKDWISRCDQVEKRKASEKEIDRANKNIIKKLTECLEQRSYLKNALLYVRDTHVTLVKGYSLWDKNQKAKLYFTLEANLPPLQILFASDKSVKEFPKLVENTARLLDRLVRTQFKNHKVQQTVGRPFHIYLDTQTKYSF